MNFALNSFSGVTAGTAASSAPSATDAQHRKLTDAAQQFEGMLLQELLKPMREHSFGSGDSDSSADDPDSSGFADTLSSFGSESLATALSRSGGLGIAKLVVQQVEKQHGTGVSPPVTTP
jgi:Rod binding domain-containing protein